MEEEEVETIDLTGSGMTPLSLAAAATVQQARKSGSSVVLVEFENGIVLVGIDEQAQQDIKEFYEWKAEGIRPEAEA